MKLPNIVRIYTQHTNNQIIERTVRSVTARYMTKHRSMSGIKAWQIRDDHGNVLWSSIRDKPLRQDMRLFGGVISSYKVRSALKNELLCNFPESIETIVDLTLHG